MRKGPKKTAQADELHEEYRFDYGSAHVNRFAEPAPRLELHAH